MSEEPEVNRDLASDSPTRSPRTFRVLSRRAFVGAAALAGGGLATLAGSAQTQQELAGRQGNSASNPG